MTRIPSFTTACPPPGIAIDPWPSSAACASGRRRDGQWATGRIAPAAPTVSAANRDCDLSEMLPAAEPRERILGAVEGETLVDERAYARS